MTELTFQQKLQEANRKRAERSTITESLDWMCKKVIDVEKERDHLRDLLARVCLMADMSLDGELSDSDEIDLRELIQLGFDEIGESLNDRIQEKSNEKLLQLTIPCLDELARLESSLQSRGISLLREG